MKHRLALAALLVLAATLIIRSLKPTHAAAADSPAATYVRGALHVSIPYHAAQPGTGLLTIDVLDPDDHSLAHSERRVTVAEGDSIWQTDLKLPNTPATEDLVWHRVRYRF